MNKNILIVLGGAVLVAVLVAMLVQLSIGGGDEKPAESRQVNVVVAARDLPLGHELTAEDLAWKEWPETGLFPGAIRQSKDETPFNAVQGRVKAPVNAGEPVLRSSLFGKNEGNIVASKLPEGMRAVSIPVSAESMVAGFIGPGDYVDVVLTYRPRVQPEDDAPIIREMMTKTLNRIAAETILQNVQVLAVDQMVKRDEKDDAKIGKTVTLAVSKQDAERLVLAGEMGSLTLILRSIGDQNMAEGDWPTVTDARITTIDDEIFTEYRRVKKDAGLNSNIVRIYTGENMVEVPAP